MSRIIRDLDSVLLCVVKVTGSSGWIGTTCHQSNMKNGLSLHIVLPDSALDSFTTLTIHRSQKFQNTTKSISAQCALGEIVEAMSQQYYKAMHCALGAILDLLHNSKTSGSKIMKFTPSPTFTMRNILEKNVWPLKANKAMLK